MMNKKTNIPQIKPPNTRVNTLYSQGLQNKKYRKRSFALLLTRENKINSENPLSLTRKTKTESLLKKYNAGGGLSIFLESIIIVSTKIWKHED